MTYFQALLFCSLWDIFLETTLLCSFCAVSHLPPSRATSAGRCPSRDPGRCLEVVGSLGWLRGACCTVTWGISEATFSATVTSPESRLGSSQGKFQRFSEPCSGSVRFVRVQSRLSCLNYAPSGIRVGSGFSQALSGTPSVSLYRTHIEKCNREDPEKQKGVVACRLSPVAVGEGGHSIEMNTANSGHLQKLPRRSPGACPLPVSGRGWAGMHALACRASEPVTAETAAGWVEVRAFQCAMSPQSAFWPLL